MRLKQHIRDSKRETIENRPLYRAFRKYGYNNFIIEQLEECSEKIVNEREKYWIKYYNSYHNGYNATMGGEGSILIDRQLVINTYKQLQNCKETAKQLNVGADTVSKILKSQNIPVISGQEVIKKNASKSVHMLDTNGNIIKTFSSLTEAGLYIQKIKNITTQVKGIIVHIREVCNNKRKTAYSYKWKWNNLE